MSKYPTNSKSSMSCEINNKQQLSLFLHIYCVCVCVCFLFCVATTTLVYFFKNLFYSSVRVLRQKKIKITPMLCQRGEKKCYCIIFLFVLQPFFFVWGVDIPDFSQKIDRHFFFFQILKHRVLLISPLYAHKTQTKKNCRNKMHNGPLKEQTK